MKKRGFTLIELLVVIAIIALLLSIVMPALKKAKDMARFLICKSNLRQLCVAVNTYTSDNKGNFMPYAYAYPSPLWIDAIGKYCSNVDQARYCPEAKEMNPNPNPQGTSRYVWFRDTRNPNSPDGLSKGSYFFNGWLYSMVGITDPEKADLLRFSGGTENDFYRMASTVSVPSSIPVLLDGNYVDGWVKPAEIPVAYGRSSGLGNWTDGIVNPVDTQNFISRLLIDRHNKRVGVGFLDGHAGVAEITNLELWNLRWRPKWAQPSAAQQAAITNQLKTWQK
jgi:prepilin-type N-terminal cleavage/methylation domain-containing protein/prepilin-type processing-associated H-X9-DG protein